MKCFRLRNLTVTLEQTGFDKFTVRYGKQVKQNLSYAAAATELGGCIMHALACDDHLDNRTKKEAAKAGDSKPYFEEYSA